MGFTEAIELTKKGAQIMRFDILKRAGYDLSLFLLVI
jgi:hypothetical protein